MRISDLIGMGKQYLVLGGAVAVVLIYRKAKGKEYPCLGRKLVWWGVFVSYLIVVLGATLLSRNSIWQESKIMPLFYSYKDAWINYSITSWRNIILNICLFIPLGYLLPLGHSLFRSFWKTLLAGTLFTTGIEGIQYLASLGIFEVDDLLNNTLGTMIGYGIYMLLCAVLAKFGKKEKPVILHVILSQIPLWSVILAFTCIFSVYEMKELGNVPNQAIKNYDTENLQISSEVTFDKNQQEVPIYLCRTYSKEEAIAFARELFEKLGSELDEERNDFYEDVAVFYAKEDYSLWFYYQGGYYRFTDFKTSFPEKELQLIKDASEEEIREKLSGYGVKIPEAAEMEFQGESYLFSVNKWLSNGKICSGEVSATYYENGCFADIHYNMIEGEYYKNFSVMSQQEAYELLCKGQFQYYGSDKLNIIVKSCDLEYVIDSKGFYQPVHTFFCTINGQEHEIIIAAIS